MSDQMRKEFEDFAVKEGLPVDWLGVHGSYDAKATEVAWQAWQASRKALVVELPQPEESYFGALPYEKGVVDGINAMLDDCQLALDKAGVAYK